MSFDLNGFGKLTTAGRIFLIAGLVLSLFFAVSVTYTHAVTTLTYATNPAYASPGPGWWDDVKSKLGGVYEEIAEGVKTTLMSWTESAFASVAESFALLTIGTDTERMQAAATPAEAFRHGHGVLGGMAMTVGAVYDSPPNIHLADHFKRRLSNNLLSPAAYATVGTELLHPIEEVWAKMRDIAFGLFTLVMVVIAIMIIMKKEITPRVVVTAASAIPRLIVAIVLIHFSFAIVALFIDLFVVWLPTLIETLLGFGTLLDQLKASFGEAAESGGTALASLWGDWGSFFVFGILQGIRAYFSALTALFFIILMAIAAIVVLGFVLIQLLYRYARILILTVFGPLLLLLGALPGQEGATTNWIKELAVNTLVFPGILLVFFISLHLLTAATIGGYGHFETIPGVGEFFFAGAEQFIVSVVALVVLLLSFKIPGIIESTIKGK